MFQKKIFAALIAVLVFCATLLGLFFLFEKFKNKEHIKGPPRLTIVSDGDPGLFPLYSEFNGAPLSEVRARRYIDHELIYDVIYKFNRYALRDLPLKEAARAREHLVLAGGSFTFGEGLEIFETLPFLFEKQNSYLNTYNFAHMGGGLSLLHRYFDLMPVKEIVHEEKGTYIYLFIGNHLSRWFARPNFLSWVKREYPYYKVEDGKVVFKGEIKDQNFYKTYRRMSSTGLKDTTLHLTSLPKGARPGEWSPNELKDFSFAVAVLKKRYLEKFPKGKFVFFYHPIAGLKDEYREFLTTDLKKRGVRVVDIVKRHQEYVYENKIDYHALEIPLDGHPNFKMNKLLYQYISETVFKTAD